ncbi:MAG: M4 family metallopeptidase [Phaeodactylibacter sp.]|uniref:M4 family metallopeptidase n=1 Tax=Phaeodactylibacter sp. TaxID=1940289 RepID=UPI0032EA9B0B
MKKQLFFLLIASVLLGPGFREQPSGIYSSDAPFISVEGRKDWLRVRPGVVLSVEQALRNFNTLQDWPEGAVWQRVEIKEEGSRAHYLHQLYYQGVPVQGGQLHVHTDNDAVTMLNGKWPDELPDAQANPNRSPEEALALALAAVPAEVYAWENEAVERLLRRVRRNSEATYQPAPELVWTGERSTPRGDLKLAYRMTIHAQRPLKRELLFISAEDGALLNRINLLHTHNTPGVAETKYSGQRPIITDSMDNGQFRLVETTRGHGIETYNMLRRDDAGQAVDFLDDDNFWDNFNPNQDEVATDAHWAAASTFDYFAEHFDYIGVDGDSMALISYVHYDQNVINAFWNGDWALFGDGNGTSFTSLATVDVVAHEFMHGITQSNANLIYQDESGALNESYSDIFGTVIEFYASPELADWTIAEDADQQSDGFRNMQDPKADGHPDTYLGDQWFSSSGDNGGVHTNSGVQNHWFYLLTEGGDGVNDNLDTFSVMGLGMDTAALIAFHNLRYYLTETSNHFDARLGAIQSAKDLYGPCSDPVVQVTNAWHAVGVGNRFAESDLQPLSLIGLDSLSCGLSESTFLTVALAYTSCFTDAEAGTSIPMAFQINNGPVLQDTLTLGQALVHQDSLSFTFSIPASALAAPATHEVKVWTDYAPDNIAVNDTLTAVIENIIAQNSDLSVQSVRTPVSTCFMGEETVEVEVEFNGCDSIEAGTPITMHYQLNDGTVFAEAGTVPVTTYRGESFFYTFETPLDIPVQNANAIDAWVVYSSDFLNQNDTLVQAPASNPIPVAEYGLLTFEAGAVSQDSFFVDAGPFVQVSFAESAASAGAFGLLITGTNSFEAYQQGNYILPIASNVWSVNPDYGARVCFCADLGNVEDPLLKFDLQQSWSPVFLGNGVQGSTPYASSLRVLVNGDSASLTLKPEELIPGPFETRQLSLASYAGQQVEICFETRTGMSQAQDPFNRGDNIHLDNIIIGEALVNTPEQPITPHQLTVFPNPGKAQVNLEISAAWPGEVTLSVIALAGQEVARQKLDLGAGTQSLTLNARDWPSGVYQIVLSGKGYRSVQKWVKLQ